MNIDACLLATHQLASDWTPVMADDLATRMAGETGTVDWDSGAGETWMRVIHQGRVIAYVSSEIPLAVVERGDAPQLRNRGFVRELAVPSFDETSLSASREALEQAFGESERLDHLELSHFSVNDLWYATV